VKEASITEEIRKLIDDKIASGVVVRADWIAAGILQIKNKIEGEDMPFYRVCAYRDIVRLAKKVIGKFDATGNTPEQLVLPGFKHLCKAYPMERDGAVVLVPVTLCTSQELMARAAQLEEMAKGCRAHAREILDYVLAREAVAA
jgi:hypothetical protein